MINCNNSIEEFKVYNRFSRTIEILWCPPVNNKWDIGQSTFLGGFTQNIGHAHVWRQKYVRFGKAVWMPTQWLLTLYNGGMHAPPNFIIRFLHKIVLVSHILEFWCNFCCVLSNWCKHFVKGFGPLPSLYCFSSLDGKKL